MRTNHTKRWLRTTAVVSLAAFMPIAAGGCFGKFQLVRKVYQFNKDVDPDKWVQWFVFLLLIFPFFPIYGFAAVIDAVFANSVEFWTGENPISASVTRTIYGENGEVATVTFHPDRTADMVVTDADGQVYSLTLAQEGGTLAARDLDGKLLARVADVNGQPAIVEGAGF